MKVSKLYFCLPSETISLLKMITASPPFYQTARHVVRLACFTSSVTRLHRNAGPWGRLWRSVSRNEVQSVLAGWCRGETRWVRRDTLRKYGHVSKCCCNREWKSNSSLIRPAGIDVLPHIREGVAGLFIQIDKSDSDSLWSRSAECSRLISWPFPFISE